MAVGQEKLQTRAHRRSLFFGVLNAELLSPSSSPPPPNMMKLPSTVLLAALGLVLLLCLPAVLADRCGVS
jgi:uncharacterized protein involved in exopolysaccharide biosynthesis